MPLYDYECQACGWTGEKFAPIAYRHNQWCGCESPLTLVLRPQPRYVPFHPYFDEGLGVEVTGKDQRLRIMREIRADFRDHPSPGDRSARLDRIRERKRNT